MFRQKVREGEKEGEKHHCVVASRAPPTGDLAHNPGMCPAWELNQRSFGLQTNDQSTEPHQPGPRIYEKNLLKNPLYVNSGGISKGHRAQLAPMAKALTI